MLLSAYDLKFVFMLETSFISSNLCLMIQPCFVLRLVIYRQTLYLYYV